MPYQALNTAITGLRAAQQQLSVISGNVSNATSPGYNRQILPQSAQVLGSTGDVIGVRTTTVIRNVDMDLQRDLWTQVSATSAYDVKVQYLNKIQDFHGPPDGGFSIAAELSELKDSFAALADAPDDLVNLQGTLNQAHIVADKFNDYEDYLTLLRNDAQSDIESTINTVNGLLEEITNINIQIKGADNFGRSVAALSDQRDAAIKELSEYMDISFFERSDGVLVVQTSDGLQLADDQQFILETSSPPLSPQQFYPDSIDGIFVTCVDMATHASARIDITERNIGGKIGALVELRDSIIPQYQAQLDELAYQMASRFEDQGLILFTDQSGNVPVGTAPDPFAVDAFGQPAPVPVDYVGFSGVIQVYHQIDLDPTLLQQGTYTSDEAIPTGDGELIRRILEFTFGEVEFQEVDGTINLDDPPGDTLFQQFGLTPQNNIIAGLDLENFEQIDFGMLSQLAAFPNLTALAASPVSPITGGANERFAITFEDASRSLGPTTITIDLLGPGSAEGQAGASALEQVVNEINAELAISGISPQLAASASIGPQNQLLVETSGTASFDFTTVVNPIGTTAATALGLDEVPGFSESLLEFFPNYPIDDQVQLDFGGGDIVTIDLSAISTNFPVGAASLIDDGTGAAFIPGPLSLMMH